MKVIQTKEELREYRLFFKADVQEKTEKYRRAFRFGCFKVHKSDNKEYFEYVKVRGDEIVPILAGLFSELREFSPLADDWIKEAAIKSRRRHNKCTL